MTVRGGEIVQAIVFGRVFEVKKDANVTFRMAGYTNETEPTGSGGLHTKQSVKLGGFDSLPLSLDPDRDDLEFLQECADSGEPGNCSITIVNGVTYAGQLVIEGEVDAASGDGQAEITALGATFEKV
ncbi:MAG: hypothetical protein PQJ59_01810 [Spirochaetales bacterium]|nr:hypothetical protein [Spirochaetales bacterium]